VKKRRFEPSITTPQGEAANYEVKSQIVRPGHTARWGKADIKALLIYCIVYIIYYLINIVKQKIKNVNFY
jgi:hypothetical protein